jgi:hypothetical protein
MDNSEIKELIIATSAQTCSLITLWGLTNYFDNSCEQEIPIYSIKILGRDMTITNKIFYQMAFFASSVLCTVNFLKTNKKL